MQKLKYLRKDGYMTKKKDEKKIADEPTLIDWLNILGPQDKWNEKHIMLAFALFGIPKRLLDIGSGTGAMVNIARKLGVDAWGVDQLYRDEEWLIQDDLSNPFDLTQYNGPSLCDMVLSIEVAEHLPADKDVVICDTIAKHVERDGFLLFSSAYPGQGGDNHYGERPPTHWRKLFDDRGLNYSIKDTAQLALLWSNISSPLMWLAANIQVFRR